MRLKWLLKLSAPKSSEFQLITCTYSERRICLLRGAGFPFSMTGKPPHVCIHLGHFYPQNLTFYLRIYCYYDSSKLGAERARRPPSELNGSSGRTGSRDRGSQRDGTAVALCPRGRGAALPRHTMSWVPLRSSPRFLHC